MGKVTRLRRLADPRKLVKVKKKI
jgi:hypothetical protein